MSLFESIENLLKKLANFNDCSKALVTLASAGGVVISLFYLIYIIFKLIQSFRLYVLSQYCCKTNFVKKYGQWAVISGATDGIGQAMARELAERGMSIVVIGRNEEKLAKTKTMLEQVPNAGQVETVKIDLSDSSQNNFEQIRAQIDPENRDIGVLINNAGMGPTKYTDFNSAEWPRMVQMVNVNVLATVHLTRMILPGMVSRGKGLVMNVSSMAGSNIAAFFSVYAPTKAFVNSFTRQLQREYISHPIDIVLLKTGPVHTKLADPQQKESRKFLVPTPEAYSKSALNAQSTGVGEYSGMMSHDFVIFMVELMCKVGLRGLIERLIVRHNRAYWREAPAETAGK